jgi:hypothetical protein
LGDMCTVISFIVYYHAPFLPTTQCTDADIRRNFAAPVVINILEAAPNVLSYTLLY